MICLRFQIVGKFSNKHGVIFYEGMYFNHILANCAQYFLVCNEWKMKVSDISIDSPGLQGPTHSLENSNQFEDNAETSEEIHKKYNCIYG